MGHLPHDRERARLYAFEKKPFSILKQGGRSMSPVTILRCLSVMGLLGIACLISGLFLPWIITYSREPYWTYTTTLWPLLINMVSPLRIDWSEALDAGFFFFLLLPLLTGILTSLAGWWGYEKRAFLISHLIFVIVGLL